MRDIVLFGVEKIIYDLEYIFEWKSCRHIVLRGGGQIQIDDSLFSISLIDKSVFDGKDVIICNKRGCAEEELLKRMGLHNRQDYTFAEERLYEVNEVYKKAGGRKIAVFGTGEIAKIFSGTVNNWKTPIKINAFMDNMKKGDWNNISIINPQEIKDWEDWFVVIAVEKAREELVMQLTGHGLKEKKDFIFYTEILEDLEPMLYKTVFGDIISDFLCIKPFGYADVNLDGIHMCCPYMMPDTIGSLSDFRFLECWNSRKARIIRLSVINGTYTFCNLDFCFQRVGERNINNGIIPEHYKTEALAIPDTMILAYDASCNLSCPSCRERVMVYPPEVIEERRKWSSCLLEEAIPYVNNLWIAGCGEPFFSRLYREILEDQRVQSRERITILTNGTLADKKNLSMVLDKYKYLNVMVSLDGLDKATVEVLRRGANYEKLIANIEYMGSLRRRNKINNLYISFVLQDKNIREFEAMVKWCEEIGVDRISVLKLYPQGQLSQSSDYCDQTVFNKYGEVRECYQSFFTEYLINHPIIDWGNCKIGKSEMSREQIYDDFYFNES